MTVPSAGSSARQPIISIIVPTRQRTAQLGRFLDSIRATARDPQGIELILVLDQDDQESIQFQWDKMPVKRVLVTPGLSMGSLNMAGYRETQGQYVMLLNDDVIARTPGWDEQVLAAFRSFPDGMVLVHVNDSVFKDSLCIFPFVTRKFCSLMDGICKEGYRRYRIDDHIHNIFDLLSLLGHHRRVFLPDVLFEHTNLEAAGDGAVHYIPNQAIHALDTTLFDSLLEERKGIALAAMGHIIGDADPIGFARCQHKLDQVTDSVAIRLPEHARWLHTGISVSAAQPRVTVGIVSADFRSAHAIQCLDLVKAHTGNYELILIDNNRDPGFNHSREMNRMLSICRTEYLVLMDDDVLVEPGWLGGLLRGVGPEVGVVTPLHKDRYGSLSYAGIVMSPDDTGHHTHILEVPNNPRPIQTICSAIMLIHMDRCGHVRLDENYSKYFLDIDYGLQIWEQGFQVVCSPYCQVTHLAGATLEQGSPRSAQLFEEQRLRYWRSWVDSGRIRKLRQGIWTTIPEITWLTQMSEKIDRLVTDGAKQDREAFLRHAHAAVHTLRFYPVFREYIASRARLGIGQRPARADDPETGHLAVLLGLTGLQPVLFEEGFDGMNLVLDDSIYYALPQTEGTYSHERIVRSGYSRSFEAESAAALKSLILNSKGIPLQGHIRQPALTRVPDAGPAYRSIGRMNPLVHYLEIGGYEGRDPHPAFNTAYYLANNPEVATMGMTPLEHFLEIGAAKGCKPNADFDPLAYLQEHPEAAEEGINPLVHYLLHNGRE